ncbi:MAG: protein kinase, partial [Gemmatimonadota bacterium]
MTDPIERINAALDGRYRIEREIGQGGMATVYLADDVRHNRKVALKVLKPELAAVVGADRFLAEIEVTAKLQHPHILPLFDSGEADGFLFFVMPYIEGETLRDRIDREKQLPVDEAVGIARAVAAALSVAHEQGVIHRDIKPGNILLSRGEPLVADFGISLAVAQAGGARLTETGLSVGTPYYMSPEQATGDREITAASDVYALGCVLYEMLVGEPPYVGNTAQAVLGKILTEKPRSPTQVRSVLPPNIEAAVMRSLEKLPADRFMSASGFVRALTDTGFRHGPDPSQVAGQPSGSRTLLTGGLAVATVVLLATTLWGWLRPAAPAPVVRFELTLPEGLVPATGQGVNFAISPDGSRVVFAASSPGQAVQLWQRALDQLGPAPIAGTEDARNPVFSPGGDAVAFSAGGRLTTVSLTGAPPLALVTEGVMTAGGGVSWGEDGWLYFRRPGQGIWRVSENGGQPEQVTEPTPPDLGHSWMEALPGGRGLLFTRDLGAQGEDEIAALDLESGEIRTVLQGAMARYARSGHIVFTSGEGTLLAAPFDLGRLEVTGPARTLLEGVQVNAGSASYFAMSSTGALIYRSGGEADGGSPVWIGRDGSEELLDPAIDGVLSTPAVSPDGRKVAFQRTGGGSPSDIWIYDADQGTFTRLTFEGSNIEPFWSPDGREVGFSSDRGG